jgi:hypothetical protein
MKKFVILISLLIMVSCNKSIYGIYNTNYSKDKSVFFQIKLNPDHTVEKTEIHTISDFSSGTYIVDKKKVICYLDSSKNKFPQDTLVYRIKDKKLYLLQNGNLNKAFYLKKEKEK